MKKVYVNPTAQTYTVDQTDVITTSGVKKLDNGDLGINGSRIFGE